MRSISEFAVAYLRTEFLAALSRYSRRVAYESDGFTMVELCL